MSMATTFLFDLDDRARARVACDETQLLLQVGNPSKTKAGKRSGYTSISFVRSTKDILVRCVREKQPPLSINGVHHLMALEDDFHSIRRALTANGEREVRAALATRCAAIVRGLSTKSGRMARAAMVHDLTPIETPKIDLGDRSILLCNRCNPPELLGPGLFPLTHGWVRQLGDDVYDDWLVWLPDNIKAWTM